MQKLNVYSNTLQGYVQTGTADKDKLIQQIALIKGAKTMHEFAAEIGVNVSTVSRILAGKVDKIRPAILVKLAELAAPETGITLDTLLAAQGMVKAESGRQTDSLYELSCRQAIVDELLSKGYTAAYLPLGDSRFDFAIRTNALKGDGGDWYIDCQMRSVYGGRTPYLSQKLNMWVDSAMALYYQGFKASRLSLIVNTEEAFILVKKRLESLSIPDEISVIYFDDSERKVRCEYIAPSSSGLRESNIFDAL